MPGRWGQVRLGTPPATMSSCDVQAAGAQVSLLSLQCAENTKFLVRASYLEIYNEDVRDLLGTDTKQKLEVGAALTGVGGGS